MNTLPSISEHIDQNTINKVIEDNFAALAPSFYTLASNWFVRAYDHYKDIDKFIIIIYLINQDLVYFRQHMIKIDYDTFYKDKSCLLYTSPSPRDVEESRMPSSA